MPKLILQQAELDLHTRRKSPIKNRMSRMKPDDGAYLLEQQHSKEFPRSKAKRVGPCSTYNCHGMTFGTRRTMIDSAQVPMILEEDDYQEIGPTKVLPGDIVIYYSSGLGGSVVGDAEHSGIVLAKEGFNLLILSKWGPGDERVHFLADCPYDPSNVKFYRITDDPRRQTAGIPSSGERLLGR